jgi:hypothetical protein
MDRILTVLNENGDAYRARMIFPGDRYGRSDCLTLEGAHPIITIYDAAHEFDVDQETGAALGQFVSSYRAETFLAIERGRNLDMHGGVPKWKLDSTAVLMLQRFVERSLRDHVNAG